MKKHLLAFLLILSAYSVAEAARPTSARMEASLRRASMGRILVARAGMLVGEVTAPACTQAGWNSGVTDAMNGDTLIIPVGDCTWTGSTSVAIGKALVIRGEEPCDLAANFLGDQVPTDCGVNIITNFTTDSSPLINWTFPLTFPFANSISEIKLTPGTDTGSGNQPFILFNGNTKSTTTIRAFHMMNNGWEGRFMWFANSAGVADHNYVDSDPEQGFYVQARNFYGPNDEAPTSPDFGDASWLHPVEWGMPSATQIATHGYPSVVFLEHNTIRGGSRACSDGESGGRYVFRYNVAYKCTPAHHGSDSSGRSRSLRSAESYKNHFVKDGGSREYMYEDRDAPVYVWGNTSDYSPGMSSALLKNYRSAEFFPPWGPMDGMNPLDVNDGGNPYVTGTATGGSASTLIDTTKTWTTNQWAGYILKWLTRNGDGTLCANLLIPETACFVPIVSNTACNPGTCVITYLTAGDEITTSANDQYEINKVTRALDQPGRGGGSKLQATQCSGSTFSMASGTVTVSNCTAHGMVDGDIVIPDIQSNSCSGRNAREWAVPSVVDVTSSSSFTFAYPYGLSSSLSCSASGGNVTKVPAGWNDQEDEPTLAWSNTNNGSAAGALSISPGTQHVLGETYADYAASFSGAKGTIGAGDRADRPASCAVGSWYFSEDQGAQGELDKCTAPNTWEDAWYVPYTNPHPLSATGPQITSITPNNGDEGAVVDLEIEGSSFTDECVVNVSGSGITISMTDCVDEDTITTRFTIAASATVGSRNVTVTTAAGTSSVSNFTVHCTTASITFTSQPTNSQVGQILNPAVSVALQCGDGSTNTASTATISYANKAGTCTGMTLDGTTSGSAVKGVFSSSNLVETGAIGSCTLQASSAGLSTIDSAAFLISNAGGTTGLPRINARIR